MNIREKITKISFKTFFFRKVLVHHNSSIIVYGSFISRLHFSKHQINHNLEVLFFFTGSLCKPLKYSDNRHMPRSSDLGMLNHIFKVQNSAHYTV